MKLYDFQKKGGEFLASRNHALLADQMGLGKTAQAITAAMEVNAFRILVVCPKSAKYNWQNEFLAITNINSYVCEGLPDFSDPIVICTFENLVKNLRYYKEVRWDLVIVDESHFVKSPFANRTRAVLGSKGILHNTKRMWLLSGTPAPNHAGEVWTMLKTFGYTKMSYDAFVNHFCNAYRIGGRYTRLQISGTNTKHSPELREMLKQFGLRRLKKDVLKDLPPMTHNTIYVEPDTTLDFSQEFQAKLAIEFHALFENLGMHPMGAPVDKLLSTLQLMSQSISSLRRYHGMQKIKPVAELIQSEFDMGLYDKLVVFGIHTDVIEQTQELLSDFGSVKIVGSTPAKDRQAAVEAFQHDPKTKIFFGNISAAGTAITLTAASQVLFIEQDWVPGNNAQAADRLHRIGQSNAVSARYVAIHDSLDAKITSTLTRKIREISTFIE